MNSFQSAILAFAVAAGMCFTAVRAAEIHVEVVPEKPFVQEPESLLWTVIVSNPSDTTLTNTVLRLTLPEGIYGVEPEEFSYEPSTSVTFYYPAGSVVEYDIGTMPPGYSLPVRVTTWPRADAASGTTLTMNAQAEADQAFDDGAATSVITWHASSLQISSPSMHAETNRTHGCSAVYSYQGGTPLEDARLVVSIPNGLRAVSATQGFGWDGSNLTWKFGTLVRGDNGARWFDLKSTGTVRDGTVVIVKAEIRQGSAVRNRALWPMVISSSAGMTCRTFASGRQVEEDGSVLWSVEVINQSAYPASGARLLVNLPSNVSSLDPRYFSPRPATSTFFGYSPGQRVHYDLGTLDPGARKLFQFRAWPRSDTPEGNMFLASANTDSDNGIRGTSSQSAVAFGPFLPMVPDIRVECPEFRVYEDGSSSKVSFGSRKKGKTATRRFFIRNLGALDLTIGRIKVIGKHAKDWKIAALSRKNLLSREKGSFVVKFKPRSKGTRRAKLRILSNDPDESPYDVKLTGKGK